MDTITIYKEQTDTGWNYYHRIGLYVEMISKTEFYSILYNVKGIIVERDY